VAVNEHDAGELVHGAGLTDVNFPGPLSAKDTETLVAIDGPELKP
jgi:hypothetical protein